VILRCAALRLTARCLFFNSLLVSLIDQNLTRQVDNQTRIKSEKEGLHYSAAIESFQNQ
jgi:hypothetical protein